VSDESTAHSILAARAIWRSKGAAGTGKKARKSRRKQIAESVDRRSLKATGRTEQFNFRAREGLKERAQEAAEAAGIPLAEWMEQAVEAYLAQESGVAVP
jgi:predicted HicB family RNase H-like nuclease